MNIMKEKIEFYKEFGSIEERAFLENLKTPEDVDAYGAIIMQTARTLRRKGLSHSEMVGFLEFATCVIGFVK